MNKREKQEKEVLILWLQHKSPLKIIQKYLLTAKKSEHTEKQEEKKIEKDFFEEAETLSREGNSKAQEANPRTLKGGARIFAVVPVCTLYLLENSNLLNSYGPFIFGSHVREYVWLDSDKTKTKP